MQTDQSLSIMKALADKSRLAIVNSLLERSQYVEELAKRHALAPSTISFHLRKLEQAGLVRSRKEQYYMVVVANDAIFDTTLRQIVAANPVSRDLQEQRIAEYRRKVLDTFFRHGVLTKLPAQHKKRRIVLEQFALRLDPDRHYSEQEVTDLITPLFADYCTIRRLLVDEGLIHRDGNSYWREPSAAATEAVAPLPRQRPKGSEATSKGTRKQIKRTLKQAAPEMGIFQIRCRANGKIYVAASRNLEGERNSRLFQLKMGKIVFSPQLQEDLDQYGAKQFEFSVLAVMDSPEPGVPVERALSAMELEWLEKLQPFGEKGYNSAKKYQRDRQRLPGGVGNE